MKRLKLETPSVLTLLAMFIWFGSITPVSAQADHSADKNLHLVGTRWRVLNLTGKPVQDEGSDLYFALKQDQQFSGGSTGQLVSPSSDGCNDLTGTYEVDGRSLHIDFVTSTLVACRQPPLRIGKGIGPSPSRPVDQPKLFIDVLRQTASFRIRSSTLELLNKNGEVVANLTASRD
jgi:heat shock protein HslJ